MSLLFPLLYSAVLAARLQDLLVVGNPLDHKTSSARQMVRAVTSDNDFPVKVRPSGYGNVGLARQACLEHRRVKQRKEKGHESTVRSLVEVQYLATNGVSGEEEQTNKSPQPQIADNARGMDQCPPT